MSFSYYANKYWTFEDKVIRHERDRFLKFILFSLVGMLINVFVSFAVLSMLKAPVVSVLQLQILSDGVWVNIGALIGSGVGLIWNFSCYKFIIFRKGEQDVDEII